ncbi:MAG: short chain dehydrogenase family protein [Nevskia sp.]|nr:short chain dehydrogenase family protein [Nevskia sp.]
MSTRYAGKAVFVTGAGAGIGRAYAQAFAAEGAAIAVTDIDSGGAVETAQMINDAGGRALALTLDVSNEEDVQRAVAQAQAAFGELDVLINNAGIAYGEIYQLTSMSPERLRRMFEVNVLGMLYCARACRDTLRRRAGVVLNMSSMAAYMANGAYSLTKAAVNNLTLVLADEFADDGIRVNGIAPGLMASPAALQNVNAVFQQRIRDAQLVARGGEMSDVTHLALFLASAEASFINGQTLLVDGGFLRHSARAIPVPLALLPNH